MLHRFYTSSGAPEPVEVKPSENTQQESTQQTSKPVCKAKPVNLSSPWNVNPPPTSAGGPPPVEREHGSGIPVSENKKTRPVTTERSRTANNPSPDWVIRHRGSTVTISSPTTGRTVELAPGRKRAIKYRKPAPRHVTTPSEQYPKHELSEIYLHETTIPSYLPPEAQHALQYGIGVKNYITKLTYQPYLSPTWLRYTEYIRAPGFAWGHTPRFPQHPIYVPEGVKVTRQNILKIASYVKTRLRQLYLQGKISKEQYETALFTLNQLLNIALNPKYRNVPIIIKIGNEVMPVTSSELAEQILGNLAFALFTGAPPKNITQISNVGYNIWNITINTRQNIEDFLKTIKLLAEKKELSPQTALKIYESLNKMSPTIKKMGMTKLLNETLKTLHENYIAPYQLGQTMGRGIKRMTSWLGPLAAPAREFIAGLVGLAAPIMIGLKELGLNVPAPSGNVEAWMRGIESVAGSGTAQAVAVGTSVASGLYAWIPELVGTIGYGLLHLPQLKGFEQYAENVETVASYKNPYAPWIELGVGLLTGAGDIAELLGRGAFWIASRLAEESPEIAETLTRIGVKLTGFAEKARPILSALSPDILLLEGITRAAGKVAPTLGKLVEPLLTEEATLTIETTSGVRYLTDLYDINKMLLEKGIINEEEFNRLQKLASDVIADAAVHGWSPNEAVEYYLKLLRRQGIIDERTFEELSQSLKPRVEFESERKIRVESPLKTNVKVEASPEIEVKYGEKTIEISAPPGSKVKTIEQSGNKIRIVYKVPRRVMKSTRFRRLVEWVHENIINRIRRTFSYELREVPTEVEVKYLGGNTFEIEVRTTPLAVKPESELASLLPRSRTEITFLAAVDENGVVHVFPIHPAGGKVEATGELVKEYVTLSGRRLRIAAAYTPEGEVKLGQELVRGGRRGMTWLEKTASREIGLLHAGAPELEIVRPAVYTYFQIPPEIVEVPSGGFTASLSKEVEEAIKGAENVKTVVKRINRLLIEKYGVSPDIVEQYGNIFLQVYKESELPPAEAAVDYLRYLKRNGVISSDVFNRLVKIEKVEKTGITFLETGAESHPYFYITRVKEGENIYTTELHLASIPKKGLHIYAAPDIYDMVSRASKLVRDEVEKFLEEGKTLREAVKLAIADLRSRGLGEIAEILERALNELKNVRDLDSLVDAFARDYARYIYETYGKGGIKLTEETAIGKLWKGTGETRARPLASVIEEYGERVKHILTTPLSELPRSSNRIIAAVEKGLDALADRLAVLYRLSPDELVKYLHMMLNRAVTEPRVLLYSIVTNLETYDIIDILATGLTKILKREGIELTRDEALKLVIAALRRAEDWDSFVRDLKELVSETLRERELGLRGFTAFELSPQGRLLVGEEGGEMKIYTREGKELGSIRPKGEIKIEKTVKEFKLEEYLNKKLSDLLSSREGRKILDLIITVIGREDPELSITFRSIVDRYLLVEGIDRAVREALRAAEEAPSLADKVRIIFAYLEKDRIVNPEQAEELMELVLEKARKIGLKNAVEDIIFRDVYNIPEWRRLLRQLRKLTISDVLRQAAEEVKVNLRNIMERLPEELTKELITREYVTLYNIPEQLKINLKTRGLQQAVNVIHYFEENGIKLTNQDLEVIRSILGQRGGIDEVSFYLETKYLNKLVSEAKSRLEPIIKMLEPYVENNPKLMTLLDDLKKGIDLAEKTFIVEPYRTLKDLTGLLKIEKLVEKYGAAALDALREELELSVRDLEQIYHINREVINSVVPHINELISKVGWEGAYRYVRELEDVVNNLAHRFNIELSSELLDKAIRETLNSGDVGIGIGLLRREVMDRIKEKIDAIFNKLLEKAKSMNLPKEYIHKIEMLRNIDETFLEMGKVDRASKLLHDIEDMLHIQGEGDLKYLIDRAVAEYTSELRRSIQLYVEKLGREGKTEGRPPEAESGRGRLQLLVKEKPIQEISKEVSEIVDDLVREGKLDVGELVEKMIKSGDLDIYRFLDWLEDKGIISRDVVEKVEKGELSIRDLVDNLIREGKLDPNVLLGKLKRDLITIVTIAGKRYGLEITRDMIIQWIDELKKYDNYDEWIRQIRKNVLREAEKNMQDRLNELENVLKNELGEKGEHVIKLLRKLAELGDINSTRELLDLLLHGLEESTSMEEKTRLINTIERVAKIKVTADTLLLEANQLLHYYGLNRETILEIINKLVRAIEEAETPEQLVQLLEDLHIMPILEEMVEKYGLDEVAFMETLENWIRYIGEERLLVAGGLGGIPAEELLSIPARELAHLPETSIPIKLKEKEETNSIYIRYRPSTTPKTGTTISPTSTTISHITYPRTSGATHQHTSSMTSTTTKSATGGGGGRSSYVGREGKGSGRGRTWKRYGLPGMLARAFALWLLGEAAYYNALEEREYLVI